MRKTLLTLLLLGIAYSLAAQEDKKHEISIGLGISGLEMPGKVLVNAIDWTLNSEYQLSTDDKKRSGLYLSYKFHINKKWSIGTTLTYKYLKSERSSNTLEAKYTQKFYGINLESQYTYLKKSVFCMYVLGGAGVYTCQESLLNMEETGQNRSSNRITNFTYQISPLCFELGTNIGAKMEYGYGYKGIVSVGAYIRF